jgi:hypothetical protein
VPDTGNDHPTEPSSAKPWKSMVLWDDYTDEGFDNDVFGALFMLKLRFTMSYLFKPKQE